MGLENYFRLFTCTLVMPIIVPSLLIYLIGRMDRKEKENFGRMLNFLPADSTRRRRNLIRGAIQKGNFRYYAAATLMAVPFGIISAFNFSYLISLISGLAPAIIAICAIMTYIYFRHRIVEIDHYSYTWGMKNYVYSINHVAIENEFRTLTLMIWLAAVSVFYSSNL